MGWNVLTIQVNLYIRENMFSKKGTGFFFSTTAHLERWVEPLENIHLQQQQQQLQLPLSLLLKLLLLLLPLLLILLFLQDKEKRFLSPRTNWS